MTHFPNYLRGGMLLPNTSYYNSDTKHTKNMHMHGRAR